MANGKHLFLIVWVQIDAFSHANLHYFFRFFENFIGQNIQWLIHCFKVFIYENFRIFEKNGIKTHVANQIKAHFCQKPAFFSSKSILDNAFCCG